MAMVDADWTIDRATKNIRYTGGDHDGTGGVPSYATVIQFHRWLQLFADDAEFTGDDELDITDKTPTTRSTDNIITLVNSFNITNTESEHLFDGSIIQAGGDTIWDGIVNFGNVGINIQLIQDAGVLSDDWWNYGVGGTDDTSANAAFMTDTTASFTTNAFVGYVIKNTTDGSQALITANDATTVTGTLYGGTEDDWDSSDAYLISQGLNNDSTQGISHRFLIPTRLDGVDIDRRRILGTSRVYEQTYSEFNINQTARGNNVLALKNTNDLNNTTAFATIDALADITNTEGLRLLDIDVDTTNEEYYSEWTRGANTINIFYEHTKKDSADASAVTLNGLNGELFRGITHQIVHDNELGTAPTTNDELAYGTNLIYDTETLGPFTVGEAIHEDTATPVWKGRVLALDDDGATGSIILDLESGTITTADTFTGQTSGAKANTNGTPAAQTSAGVFRIFAYDDDGVTGNTYGQLMKGTAPVNNEKMFFGGATADVGRSIDVNVTVTERTVSTPFSGIATGSALIGAHGFGMVAADASSADLFFDLSNATINPPNNVTFTLTGLFIGEDRILVTNDSGTDIDTTQMATDTTLSGAAETSVSINPAPGIPSDTPDPSGTIRIERDDGLYSRHPYSAVNFATDTFTITSHDFSTNNATTPANAYISYLDLLATATSHNFSYVYNADRTHFIRVADGGDAGDNLAIVTDERTGIMSSTGATVAVTRISDE